MSFQRRTVSTPNVHDDVSGAYIDNIGEEKLPHDDAGKKHSSWTRYILAGLTLGLMCLYLFHNYMRVAQGATNSSMQLQNKEESFHTPDLSLPIKVTKSSGTEVTAANNPNIPKPAESLAASAVATTRVESAQVTREVVEAHIDELRRMKKSGVVMETDEAAKKKIAVLQDELRTFIVQEYGPEPYRVEMTLTFPETMKDYETAGPTGVIVFELAPLKLVPYSTFFFLEIIRKWKGGAFHRNAGHVLQALVHSDSPGLAFQEYSPEYPHKRLTLGYAGRPGGPAFYISTIDNTDNHGPASQGSKTEADSCFGKVIAGEDIVKRMQRQPGRQPPSGFIDGPKNYIKISGLKLMK